MLLMEIENIQDRRNKTEGHLFVPVLHESLLRGKGMELQRQTVYMIPLFSQKNKEKNIHDKKL